MAQNVKFGDVDVEIPSFDFNKIGKFLPFIIIVVYRNFK